MNTLGKSVINPKFEKLELDARKKQNELLDLEIETLHYQLHMKKQMQKIELERQKVALQIEKKSI